MAKMTKQSVTAVKNLQQAVRVRNALRGIEQAEDVVRLTAEVMQLVEQHERARQIRDKSLRQATRVKEALLGQPWQKRYEYVFKTFRPNDWAVFLAKFKGGSEWCNECGRPFGAHQPESEKTEERGLRFRLLKIECPKQPGEPF